ncbi:ubiquitin-like domain-containing protein [Isoptericola sp. S6320L]|uniref:aggregation-promoting factor C-terminal-like domain-containing protein n=1 Tax=Isoptericola sp. S6320L TaxID=2926411 RepID=UPI001FF16C90|nr:ubiquitin-like domain-containing protein [Isoptericola sp. S6320L]MCK0118105.1 ubiquitin-like domain-containing protein [Isoptericola sp. S6320L]
MTSAPENTEPRPTTAETRAVRTHRSRRRRALIAGATAGTLVLGVGSAVAVSQAHKTVTLDVDGETRTVGTFAGDVDGLLAAEGVTVGDRDLVAPAADSPLSSDAEVVVRTGKEVDVAIDGRESTAWVTAADAHEALNLLAQRGEDVALVASRSEDRADLPLQVHDGDQVAVVHDETVDVADGSDELDAVLADVEVEVDEDDMVTLSTAADAGVRADDLPEGTDVPQVAVVVQRVEVEQVTKVKEIDFETKTKKSSQRFEDLDPKVRTKGEPGSRTVVREITTIDGKTVSDEKVTSLVTAEPVTEVLVQGTKERPEPDPEPATSSGSSSGSSSGVAASTGGYSGSNREIGQQMAAARGWTGGEWTCLESLWTKESGWSHTAANPSSGAYGIPQSLPGSKMATAGADWQTNPATQISWGLDYIAGRYGSPCGAWGHSQANNWY